MKIRLAYFGSNDFSADFLERLLQDSDIPIEVVLVVTQPDQPVGRKKILTPTPVKIIAQKNNLPIFDGGKYPISNIQYPMNNHLSNNQNKAKMPISNDLGRAQERSDEQAHSSEEMPASSDNLISLIKELNIDLALLYSYGKIIPKDLLEAPKYGFWNIHPSLLPKYRGTSPMVYPLILGEGTTGVTLMKMDEKMDHGELIGQKEMSIEHNDRRPDLEKKLTVLAFELFKNHFPLFPSSSLLTHEQDHLKATYTRFMKKDDGYIPLSVLKKALKNESLTSEEIPTMIKEYYEKNPNVKLPMSNKIQSEDILFRTTLGRAQQSEQAQISEKNGVSSDNESSHSKIENSSEIIFDYFKGLYPWPGIWTLIQINNQEKRLKITDVELIDTTFHIKKVQLEGKNEVGFEEFSRTYPTVFS